jgi:hypothetical protein
VNYLEAIAAALQRYVEPEHVPADSNSLFLMYAVLVRAKGELTTAEDVHDVWTSWMSSRGQVHESMRPFNDLDPAVQSEDEPFLLAIQRLSRER